MNICKPNTESAVYKQFISEITAKVSKAVNWLEAHSIKYVQNYTINNHLYRIYILDKDLLLDFENYPCIATEYNYIRINYDTDIISLLETIFPETILDTASLEVWKLNRRSCNRFLKENGISPIYDTNVLRIAFVRDATIYQCIVLKDNRIIANVTKHSCSIKLGTYMLLRYLTEVFGVDDLQIKVSSGNSYSNILYQCLGLPCIYASDKKKIWWSASETKWHIKREDTNKYIPFYYCGYHVYKYSSQNLHST